jgi:hypothetical protein
MHRCGTTSARPPRLGPQTMARAQTMTPVSGRPAGFEQQQIASGVGALLRELRREQGMGIRDLERRPAAVVARLARLGTVPG